MFSFLALTLVDIVLKILNHQILMHLHIDQMKISKQIYKF